MTREERLAFCKICTHRKMDFNQGLICSITNSKADFEESCTDFDKDQEEKDRLLHLELASAGRDDVGDAVNAKKNKENGALIFLIGVIITLISHSISASTGFFVVTYGAIIYGARQYMKGVEQAKILQREHDEENEATTNKV